MNREKLKLLQVGRAVAALAVVVYHAAKVGDSYTSGRLTPWFDWGQFGVDFFFVLSGFIIYYAHRDDARDLASARRFAVKRLRRIYVPYLPVGLAMVAVYLWLPRLSSGTPHWSLLTSLTLLPSHAPPALEPAWTLVFEITFYAFFLLFYATRYFWWIVAAWAAAIVTLFLTGLGPAPGSVAAHYIDPVILEFFAGMAMAHVARNARPSWWRILVPASAVLALAALVAVTTGFPRVVFGLALAPLVLGLVLYEREARPNVHEFWMLLGAASYAIYLVHEPLFSVVGRVVTRWDSWWLAFGTSVIVAVVAGVAYHLWYERPVVRMLSPSSRNPSA